jgi:hypothetical protein
MFALYQLDFYVIPVSIFPVSLTSRQTWQNVNCKRILQRMQNVQQGKRHQKKIHLAALSLFLLFYGRTFQTTILKVILAETSCWEIERK